MLPPSVVGRIALGFVVATVLGFFLVSGEPPSIVNPHIAIAASAETTTSRDPFSDLQLSAKSAIVMDLADGKILYQYNPDAQLPLASITKVPLVLAIAEVLPSEAVITIPRDTAPKRSAERLGKGERWYVRDVINFTLVASSNEGATILADLADPILHVKYPQYSVRGATLARMNSLMQELHLTHTYFLNVSGLDQSKNLSGGYGSAGDMAALFAYAVRTHPDLFAATQRDVITLTSADGKEKTHAFNTDNLQGEIPGLIMGKTGLTDLAGGNLVVVFDIGPVHPVVAVVLGSTETGRFSDTKSLIEATQEVVVH